MNTPIDKADGIDEILDLLDIKTSSFKWNEKLNKPVEFNPRKEAKKALAQYIRSENKKQDNKVTRFEVIDDTGRAYVAYDVKIERSYQDDDRTLKVFVR